MLPLCPLVAFLSGASGSALFPLPLAHERRRGCPFESLVVAACWSYDGQWKAKVWEKNAGGAKPSAVALGGGQPRGVCARARLRLPCAPWSPTLGSPLGCLGLCLPPLAHAAVCATRNWLPSVDGPSPPPGCHRMVAVSPRPFRGVLVAEPPPSPRSTMSFRLGAKIQVCDSSSPSAAARNCSIGKGSDRRRAAPSRRRSLDAKEAVESWINAQPALLGPPRSSVRESACCPELRQCLLIASVEQASFGPKESRVARPCKVSSISDGRCWTTGCAHRQARSPKGLETGSLGVPSNRSLPQTDSSVED